MSQKNVLNYLKKNKGKWFTTKEIAPKVKIGINSCTKNLSRLMKSGLIRRKNNLKKPVTFEYSFKGDIYFERKKPLDPDRLREEYGE